jgi:hypothetical protein
VDREALHRLRAEPRRLAGGAEVGAEVDGDDALALRAEVLVDGGEVARAGRAGGGQLLRGGQLGEELVAGQVDPVLERLVAEKDLEGYDLDGVLLPPRGRQVGRGVGDDAELGRRGYSTLRMNG